jgi:hypothetical protein
VFVRKTLEDALYAAYPSFFRQKDLPITESGMSSGIECWDGWYAIVDGLCLVLSTHARQDGHPPIEAAQVKQKFGSLRFHIDGACDWCRGAIRFTSVLSCHICEQTGRPGMLMVQTPPRRWVRTLAEDVGRAMGYVPVETETDLLVENGPLPGWRIIAGVLVSTATQHMPSSTLRLGHADGELLVDGQIGDTYILGAIACARALAVRTDPVTSAMEIPR